MKDLSQARKKFYISLLIIFAFFVTVAPLLLALIGWVFPQSEEDAWNGWDKLALDYLAQQEEIAERYDEEYTFRCTKLHYDYQQGGPVYSPDESPVPTNVEVTVVVYKGSAVFTWARDIYTVYFVRNEDGTYRADRYKHRRVMLANFKLMILSFPAEHLLCGEP